MPWQLPKTKLKATMCSRFELNQAIWFADACQRTNSGSLAIFAAILLASSFVSNFAADHDTYRRTFQPCFYGRAHSGTQRTAAMRNAVSPYA
jgi:hypothetical protein